MRFPFLHCVNGRVIVPEILDTLPPEQARRSLGDIVRINRYLGGHESVRKTLRREIQGREPFTLVDVGAASGDMARIIRAVYPSATVTSLDYLPSHLAAAPSPKLAADAFHLPLKDRSVDYCFCSLFLHHFTNEQVVELLASFRRVARRRVIVSDLERHLLAYHFLSLSRWVFRWDPVTIHDGAISVEAGFKAKELAALAADAGLRNVRVDVHRPAFRLALVGDVGG